MSETEPQLPSSTTDDLQFQTVESSGSNTAAAGAICAICREPITATYFALSDQMLCPNCREQLKAPAAGSKFGRLAIATLMGLGAGLAGALLWFVIRRVTHYEIGLVAVLVGVMVGKAVRKGSRGVGGRGYQVLAVVLTYFCIASNYVPDILEAVFNVVGQSESPGEAVFWTAYFMARVFKLALTLPFQGNVIGLLIIGFALWEAWKLNARRPLTISGPYQLGASATA